MFDTMTFTKVVGAFCGSLLIFMLGGWASELIYRGSGGHYGEHQQAYVIDTGEEEGGETEAEAGPTFAELFAAADVGKGERVYNQCRACHALEQGSNGVGPYLYGVVGRNVDAADGYGYSGALSEVADVWTPQELNAFLENPAGYAPGTSMGYSGLRKAEDRANVIAFLDQTDGDVTVIEASAPVEAATEAAEEAPMEEAAAEQVTAEEPAVAAVEATPEAEAAAEEATGETAAVTEDAAAATEEAAAPAEEAVSESAFAALVAAADPAAGQRVYRQCQACHVPDAEQNRVGPHMVGLLGRDIGGVEGFRYSNVLAEMGGVWDYDNLNAWLEDPKAFAPGNKMSFRGLSDEEDRAAVIAYIESVQP